MNEAYLVGVSVRLRAMYVTRLRRGALAALVLAVLTGVLGMHGLPAHGVLPSQHQSGQQHGEPDRYGGHDTAPGTRAGDAGHGKPGDRQPRPTHQRPPACESGALGWPAPAHPWAPDLVWPLPQPVPHDVAQVDLAPADEGGRSPPKTVTLCVFRI